MGTYAEASLARARQEVEAAGYVVLKRKSHEHTLRELDRARNAIEWEKRDAEGARQWAREILDEERRLNDRLNAVCMAAAALGVSITDINKALAAADEAVA